MRFRNVFFSWVLHQLAHLYLIIYSLSVCVAVIPTLHGLWGPMAPSLLIWLPVDKTVFVRQWHTHPRYWTTPGEVCLVWTHRVTQVWPLTASLTPFQWLLFGPSTPNPALPLHPWTPASAPQLPEPREAAAVLAGAAPRTPSAHPWPLWSYFRREVSLAPETCIEVGTAAVRQTLYRGYINTRTGAH